MLLRPCESYEDNKGNIWVITGRSARNVVLGIDTEGNKETFLKRYGYATHNAVLRLVKRV